LEQTKAAAKLISADWNYALNPLPRYGLIHSFDEFVNKSAAAEKANCNTASTLIALLDSRNNAAMGYQNASTGSPSSLSSHEGHQVVVRPDGTLIDGTPWRVTKKDAAYFKESYGEQMPKPRGEDPLLPLSLASAALTIALWRRRDPKRLYDGVHAHLSERALKQLESVSLKDLRFDKATIDNASFAPAFTVRAAERQAERDKTSAEQIHGKLALLASKKRVRELRHMANAAEPEPQAVLSRAASTLAKTRRAQYARQRRRVY
jgi:hypothetical protein